MNFSEASPLFFALYTKYKDQQPCWPLLGCALLLCTIAFFGMVFNSALIYVTFRKRTLNGTTNRLLAFNAALEIMHQTSYFSFLFLCLSGHTFIGYKLAVKIGAISIFGYSGVFPAMLCTAIDRFIAINLPFFYKTVKQKYYLSVFFIFCFAFSAYSVIIIYITAESMSTVKMTGFFADLYQGQLGTTRRHLIFVMILCTILINIFAGLTIYKKKPTTVATMAVDKFNRKIFNSLCLVISVHIGGFLLIYIYTVYLMPFLIENSVYLLTWYGVILMAIPMNISSISIAPILFVSSLEYSNAFTSEWRRLRSLIGLHPSNKTFVNTVLPVQTPTVMNRQTRSQFISSARF